jgi:hypothetical protein
MAIFAAMRRVSSRLSRFVAGDVARRHTKEPQAHYAPNLLLQIEQDLAFVPFYDNFVTRFTLT